jgi:hypothetical protein
VPCAIKKESSVKFGLCTFPSVSSNLKEPLTDYYYGYSNNPVTGLLLHYVISFIIVSIFYLLAKSNIFKRKKDVIDLRK